MINGLIPFLILIVTAVGLLVYGLQVKNKPLRPAQVGWIIMFAPFAAMAYMLLNWTSAVDKPIIYTQQWVPGLSLNFSLYIDGLSYMFALLITGIGTLVALYSGYYFKEDRTSWRFQVYLLFFMVAMLGVVLAGDVITLFMFWESTSIISYFLVAYKYKYESARAGAFKGLVITATGGVLLLLGLLLLSQVAGGGSWEHILASGDIVRGDGRYWILFILIAVGAFTKSAQTPFHIWLPGAMNAPTPASAYLHSATMVKAGVYLLARLNPALGNTELWFYVLTTFGMITMLVGAFTGMYQKDIKALLAYSTISQLGIFMMLLGQNTEIAFKALSIGIVAHALYKSALFMGAGIIDIQTGTRLFDRLGGLRRSMPFLFIAMLLAALSLAGLPPLFGFLAKETLLATAVHPSLPAILAWPLPIAVVVAAAFKLVQSGILANQIFLGEPKDPEIKGVEAPWPFWATVAIPALFSIGLGVLPEPPAVVALLASASAAAYGDKVKVSFALWQGLNIPLLLSTIAIIGGIALYYVRDRWLPQAAALAAPISIDRFWDLTIRLVERGSYLSTRLQHGRLRFYLSVIMVTTLLISFGFMFAEGTTPFNSIDWPPVPLPGNLPFLRFFALLVTSAAALGSVLLQRDFFAILAFGISGLGVAVYLILEPAPDVALVQIVVDIMAMVILVLAITRLPRAQRRLAQKLYRAQNKLGLARDMAIAAGVGLLMTWLTLAALTSRPRESVVGPFYEENAKLLTGATDIVGSIIVDYRALDTWIEVAVFAVAGIGLYTLLRYAVPAATGRPRRAISEAFLASDRERLSNPFARGLAYLSLPFALVLGITHVLYGHDQPGDGFTSGVIISLGVAFQYVVFGYVETRRRLYWVKPYIFIASGLLLILIGGTSAAYVTGSFLGHVDFGKMWGLTLPAGISLSTALMFEAAISLVVLGSVVNMLNGLGYPGDSLTMDEYEDDEDNEPGDSLKQKNKDTEEHKAAQSYAENISA
jgi:multicomponent K+:H+ antiporter subunit A